MRYLAPALLLVLIALLAAGMPAFVASHGEPPANEATPASRPAGQRFPDFGFMPPVHQYEGRVFRLSQQYPRGAPDPATVPAFCTNDFDDVPKNWKQFLMQVRAYCFEGNIHGGDVEDDFCMQDNKVRKWYHMPGNIMDPMAARAFTD